MIDKYDEKAREIATWLMSGRPETRPETIKDIAAELRECAAKAYEDAARNQCMDCAEAVPLKFFDRHGFKKLAWWHYHGIEDYYKCSAQYSVAKAAALRQPISVTQEEEGNR